MIVWHSYTDLARGLLLLPQVHVHLRGPWDREDCHCAWGDALPSAGSPRQWRSSLSIHWGQWHEADRTPPSLRADLAGEQSWLGLLVYFVLVWGVFFWSSSLQDPSSPTRDSSQALSSESAESQPLDCQGIPIWAFWKIQFLGCTWKGKGLLSFVHITCFQLAVCVAGQRRQNSCSQGPWSLGAST